MMGWIEPVDSSADRCIRYPGCEHHCLIIKVGKSDKLHDVLLWKESISSTVKQAVPTRLWGPDLKYAIL